MCWPTLTSLEGAVLLQLCKVHLIFAIPAAPPQRCAAHVPDHGRSRHAALLPPPAVSGFTGHTREIAHPLPARRAARRAGLHTSRRPHLPSKAPSALASSCRAARTTRNKATCRRVGSPCFAKGGMESSICFLTSKRKAQWVEMRSLFGKATQLGQCGAVALFCAQRPAPRYNLNPSILKWDDDEISTQNRSSSEVTWRKSMSCSRTTLTN